MTLWAACWWVLGGSLALVVLFVAYAPFVVAGEADDAAERWMDEFGEANHTEGF